MNHVPESLNTIFIAKPPTRPWPSRFFIITLGTPSILFGPSEDNRPQVELRKALSRAGAWRHAVQAATPDWKRRQPGFAVADLDPAEVIGLGRRFNHDRIFTVDDDWLSVVVGGDSPHRTLGRFSERLYAPEDEPRFCVYVIRLADSVLQVKRFRDANPGHRPGQPCYYVGMTGLSPEERYANHKAGHKPCGLVRDHGLELAPEFDEVRSPLSRKQAATMEVALAERLREQGYAVWQK